MSAMSTWHVIYDPASGRELSRTSVLPEKLQEGQAAVEIGEHETAPDGIWNPQSLALDPRPPDSVRAIRTWLKRFTLEEMVAIKRGEAEGDYVMGALLEVLRLLESARLDLDDPFLAAALDHCIAQGYLAAGRKSALLDKTVP
jgi:hypothetical protein